jgi:hypothetical protein
LGGGQLAAQGLEIGAFGDDLEVVRVHDHGGAGMVFHGLVNLLDQLLVKVFGCGRFMHAGLMWHSRRGGTRGKRRLNGTKGRKIVSHHHWLMSCFQKAQLGGQPS